MPFVRTIALATALFACGRVDVPSDPPDAPRLSDAGLVATDAAGADAPPPPGPWTTPSPVAVLSTADHVDTYPTVRGDGLEMYFVSDRDGDPEYYLDIYVSRRFAVSEPWSPPAKVLELSTVVQSESSPDLSDDGKTIWFSRTGSGLQFDLFTATRDSTSDPWGAPTRIAELSTADNEMSPHVTSDGRTIYFASGPLLDYDIYRATRSSTTEAWGSRVLVTRLSSPENDESTSTTADGLEMYIDSERDGSLSIYRSTKPPEGGSWSIPEAVPELAGAHRADVTADGHYVLLSAPGGSGFADIYEAWR